jgi:hypothetical protein
LLFDEVGVGDLDWSAKLGAAAMETLALVLQAEVEAGRSVVVEANFRRVPPAIARARVVQVYCTDTADALNERYRRRRDRHPGHLDTERIIDPDEYAPLPVDGELIEYSVGGRSVGDAVAAVVSALAAGR